MKVTKELYSDLKPGDYVISNLLLFSHSRLVIHTEQIKNPKVDKYTGVEFIRTDSSCLYKITWLVIERSNRIFIDQSFHIESQQILQHIVLKR